MLVTDSCELSVVGSSVSGFANNRVQGSTRREGGAAFVSMTGTLRMGTARVTNDITAWPANTVINTVEVEKTWAPTQAPTLLPSFAPTATPTRMPTTVPTAAPTAVGFWVCRNVAWHSDTSARPSIGSSLCIYKLYIYMYICVFMDRLAESPLPLPLLPWRWPLT